MSVNTVGKNTAQLSNKSLLNYTLRRVGGTGSEGPPAETTATLSLPIFRCPDSRGRIRNARQYSCVHKAVASVA